MIIALWIACSAVDGDTASENDSAQTEEVSENLSAGADESNSTMLQDYVFSYCSEYAMECGLYSDVESCEDILSDSLGSCTVEDEDALWECTLWLSGLTCGDEEWLSACDAAISCD